MSCRANELHKGDTDALLALQQQLSGLQSAEKQDYSQYQNDLANWTEGLQYKKNEYDNAYSAKQNGWQNFMNGALQVAGIAAKILPLFFI